MMIGSEGTLNIIKHPIKIENGRNTHSTKAKQSSGATSCNIASSSSDVSNTYGYFSSVKGLSGAAIHRDSTGLNNLINTNSSGSRDANAMSSNNMAISSIIQSGIPTNQKHFSNHRNLKNEVDAINEYQTLNC